MVDQVRGGWQDALCLGESSGARGLYGATTPLRATRFFASIVCPVSGNRATFATPRSSSPSGRLTRCRSVTPMRVGGRRRRV